MKSGGIVFKGIFFLVFAFCLFFTIMKGEPEKLGILFNISLGFWTVGALFLAALLASKDKVLPMIVDGYKQSFDEEKAVKQIKKGTISLIINLIALSSLGVLLLLNEWFIACGIIVSFLLLYSTFVSQFLGTLRREYNL